MRPIIIVFISIILAFSQLSLPGSYFFKFFIPNLVLVFLAAAAFYLEFKEIILYVFIVGFILDISSLLPFGLFLIAYLCIGSVFYFLRQVFHTSPFYSALIFTALGTILFYFLLVFLLVILSFLEKLSMPSLTLKYLTLTILPASLGGNMGLALIFSFLVKKIFTWISYYKREAL